MRWRSSLSSRVFSMAMTAWAAKFWTKLDLLVGERPNLLAVDGNRADQLALLEHRHDEQCADAGKFDGSNVQLERGQGNPDRHLSHQLGLSAEFWQRE